MSSNESSSPQREPLLEDEEAPASRSLRSAAPPTVVASFGPRWSPRLLWLLAVCFLAFGHSFRNTVRLREKFIAHNDNGSWDQVISQLNTMVRFNYYVMLFFFALALVVLPRRIQVWSDASLSIHTILCRYRLRDVRSAHRNSSCCETVKKIRLDFATDLQNRVFVKRGGNKWEVSFSPQDPDSFVETIQRVTSG